MEFAKNNFYSRLRFLCCVCFPSQRYFKTTAKFSKLQVEIPELIDRVRAMFAPSLVKPATFHIYFPSLSLFNSLFSAHQWSTLLVFQTYFPLVSCVVLINASFCTHSRTILRSTLKQNAVLALFWPQSISLFRLFSVRAPRSLLLSFNINC